MTETSSKEQRKRLVELIREVREANKGADPGEVMAEVLTAQRAVRGKSESDER